MTLVEINFNPTNFSKHDLKIACEDDAVKTNEHHGEATINGVFYIDKFTVTASCYTPPKSLFV
jgi:hypothetical protein